MLVATVLVIALSSTGVLSAPQVAYIPAATGSSTVLGPLPVDLQDTAILLHHRQDANIPDPPIIAVGKSLAEEKVIEPDDNVPESSMKQSSNSKKLAEIIGKFIAEELKEGSLKAEDIPGVTSNSNYADIVGMFFKDLLQIPLVFLHAFSDAVARLTASKPAVLITPVAVPASTAAAAAPGAPAPAPVPASRGFSVNDPTPLETPVAVQSSPANASPVPEIPSSAPIAPALPAAVPAPAVPGAIPAPSVPGAIPAPAVPGAVPAPEILANAPSAPGVPNPAIIPGAPGVPAAAPTAQGGLAAVSAQPVPSSLAK